MKPAILVTSHPNTDEKEYILKDFGNFISQYKIDHYLFTNYPATKNTQLEFKESHYINHNPPNPISNSNWITWAKFPEIGLYWEKTIPNWCFSGTYLMLKGLEYLQTLGYTHVYTFIYDTLPNFGKIKNFIELSNKTFKKGKKAIFFEYPLRENSIKGLHNSIYSGELKFLIDYFKKLIQNYNNNNLYFSSNPWCENYWEYMLRSYKDVVLVLPNKEVIPSIFGSASFDKLPNGSDFFIGRSNNKTMLATRSNISNFLLTDSKNNPISYKILLSTSVLTLFEFDSKINTSYFLNGHLILNDNINWRKTTTFIKNDKYNL